MSTIRPPPPFSTVARLRFLSYWRLIFFITTSDHKPRRKVNLQPNIPPQLRSKSNLAYRTNDNKRIKILKYQSMFLLTNSYLLAKFVLKLTFFYITTIIFFLLLKNLPLRCNDKHMHIYNSFIKKLLVKLCELNIYKKLKN